MKKTYFLLLLLVFPKLLMSQSAEGFIPKHFIDAGDTLNYRILYPLDFSEEKEYPLVLFLHGAGERGNDNESQLVHGSRLFLQNKLSGNHTAIVVFPQCPKDDYWAQVERGTAGENRFIFQPDPEPTAALALVSDLLDELLQKEYVKKEQVYIGGLSMGGMGTFELLYRRPDTFAAGIAICGGAHPDTANNYADTTDLWIFHGARDEVVSPAHSHKMAEAIGQAGGKVRLTIYGNATHNSWDPAFAEPGLLDWLFSKKLHE